MRKKICVVTGTRAEYGLFFPIMKKIQLSKLLDLQIVATTMHLSEEFGNTYKQIEKDGFFINEKVENLLSSDTKTSTAKSTGLAILLLSDVFSRLSPNVVLILGDRFEAHAAATTAMLMNIPIAHIHGGEITEGAIDEKIRHSITKMSSLHFTSTGEYRNRVIQMGEHPNTVFSVGAPGIDNILNINLVSKEDLERHLSWKFGHKSALFTYHPPTLQEGGLEKGIDDILSSIEKSDLNVIFTYANADSNGRKINQRIEKFCNKDLKRFKIVKNLGQIKYLSAMKYVNILIGNTSSGIIEAASFKKPVINIGERQKGRLRSGNVIDCHINKLDIAILDALMMDCSKVINLYGNGDASFKIVKKLENCNIGNIKFFFNLKV
jgi:UDP-hydrolysing UDP-N-acetyl-D-glucosamine 2-epimerase